MRAAGPLGLLAAGERIADTDPFATGAARRLAEGELLDERDLAQLAEPRPGRAQIQHRLTAVYVERCDRDVARQVAAFPWQARRADPVELAATVDAEQLLTCDTCAQAYPRLDDDGPTSRWLRWRGLV